MRKTLQGTGIEITNKNYEKGRRAEYKIIKKLKETGFSISQRSAGSHSPIDVFAIDVENKKIIFVQCKTGANSEREKEKAKAELSGINGYFYVETIVL